MLIPFGRTGENYTSYVCQTNMRMSRRALLKSVRTTRQLMSKLVPSGGSNQSSTMSLPVLPPVNSRLMPSIALSNP